MIGSRQWRLVWLLAILPLALGSTCVVVEEEPYGYPRNEDETEGEILEKGDREEIDRTTGF